MSSTHNRKTSVMHRYNVANESLFNTLHPMPHKNKRNHEFCLKIQYVPQRYAISLISSSCTKKIVYFKIKYFGSKLYSSILICNSL